MTYPLATNRVYLAVWGILTRRRILCDRRHFFSHLGTQSGGRRAQPDNSQCPLRVQFRIHALQQTARMGSLIDRLRAPAIDHPGPRKSGIRLPF